MDVAAELRVLAASSASGRLDVQGPDAGAHILVREGRICSVDHSAARPALGMRLVSGGCLSLTNLGAALTAQQQHPQMRLGDVLVRMGLVQRRDVEAVAWEQLCDDIAATLRMTEGTTTFHPMAPDSLPPGGPSVEDVLTAAAERERAWQEVVRHVGGPDTVPNLSDEVMGTRDVALRPTDWAVLCRVDGQRSLQSIAEQAGFTTLEAALILQSLIAAGLVSVPEAHLPPVAEHPAPWPAPAPAQAPAAPAPRVAPAPAPAHAPAAPPARIAPAPPPAAPPAPVVADDYDDPADLLRELSQLGGLDPAPRRRR